jgi:hypothetical protein
LAVVLDGYGVVVAKRAGAGPAKAARFDPGETLATDDIVAEPDLGSGVPRCLYQAQIANIRAWTDENLTWDVVSATHHEANIVRVRLRKACVDG